MGGEGRMFGTLIGAFIIAVIRNGMNLMGINSDSQEMGTCIGTFWNEDNKPVGGKKQRYRYDYNDKKWLVCNNNSTHRIDRYDEGAFRNLHLASGPWIVVLQKPSSENPIIVEWWK